MQDCNGAILSSVVPVLLFCDLVVLIREFRTAPLTNCGTGLPLGNAWVRQGD